MLHPGLYEQVINNALNRELAEIPEARKSTAPIETAEAAKVLAQYLTDVVQKGLENVQDNGGGIDAQIQLANQIVTTIQNTTQEADFAALGVDQRAAVHPSPEKRNPGAAVRARVQGRCPFWRCRGVYLSGYGELCETRGLPPHEYHMAAEPPDPCKIPQKDQQAGGRLKGEYHEGCSRCCSCDLRRYSDET